MSTITVILETAPDGTLHLPVPEELRHGKIEVVATLRPAPKATLPLEPGCLKGFWMSDDFNAPLEDFKEYQ